MLLIQHRLIGSLEDVRFTGIELARDTANDPVAWGRVHTTFECVDEAVAAYAPSRVELLTNEVAHISVVLAVPLDCRDLDRLLAIRAHWCSSLFMRHTPDPARGVTATNQRSCPPRSFHR